MFSPRVLIVDDDDYTRFALRNLFRRKGWEVSLAATVAEALPALEEWLPRFVVLDLNLPDGGGESILRQIRLQHPGTLVAVCSGSQDAAQLAEVRNLGPDLLLCKPVDVAPIERLSSAAAAC